MLVCTTCVVMAQSLELVQDMEQIQTDIQETKDIELGFLRKALQNDEGWIGAYLAVTVANEGEVVSFDVILRYYFNGCAGKEYHHEEVYTVPDLKSVGYFIDKKLWKNGQYANGELINAKT